MEPRQPGGRSRQRFRTHAEPEPILIQEVLDILASLRFIGKRNFDHLGPAARLPEGEVQVGQIAHAEEHHTAPLLHVAVGGETEEGYQIGSIVLIHAGNVGGRGDTLGILHDNDRAPSFVAKTSRPEGLTHKRNDLARMDGDGRLSACPLA